MAREHFWITNISKKAISLSDLNICIYPQRSLNLLNKKNFSFTEEQLEKSLKSGSLFIKKPFVVLRAVPPESEIEKIILIDRNAIFETKHRSTVKIEQIKHEELNISDDDYAVENAETAELDKMGKWGKK